MDPDRKGGPVVARLPLKPGRRDHEYAHLFSGEIESVPEVESAVEPSSPRRDRVAQLEARVAVLEAGLAALQRRLSTPSPGVDGAG